MGGLLGREARRTGKLRDMAERLLPEPGERRRDSVELAWYHGGTPAAAAPADDDDGAVTLESFEMEPR